MPRQSVRRATRAGNKLDKRRGRTRIASALSYPGKGRVKGPGYQPPTVTRPVR